MNCDIDFCLPCIEKIIQEESKDIKPEPLTCFTYIHHHELSIMDQSDLIDDEKCVFTHVGSCQGNIEHGISHICEYCNYMVCE